MSSDAAHLVERRKAEARANYRAIRIFFESHLCATQVECAAALGLSVMAVNRHVREIRSTRKDRP